MDFVKSIAIAASGLKAQSGRMRVISENIANADSTATHAGRRPLSPQDPDLHAPFDRELEAQTVDARPGRRRDQSAFRSRIDPGNPAADAWAMSSCPTSTR